MALQEIISELEKNVRARLTTSEQIKPFAGAMSELVTAINNNDKIAFSNASEKISTQLNSQEMELFNQAKTEVTKGSYLLFDELDTIIDNNEKHIFSDLNTRIQAAAVTPTATQTPEPAVDVGNLMNSPQPQPVGTGTVLAPSDASSPTVAQQPVGTGTVLAPAAQPAPTVTQTPEPDIDVGNLMNSPQPQPVGTGTVLAPSDASSPTVVQQPVGTGTVLAPAAQPVPEAEPAPAAPTAPVPTPRLDNIVKTRDVVGRKNSNTPDPVVAEIQNNLVKSGVAVTVPAENYKNLTKGDDGIVRYNGKVALNQADLGYYGGQTEAAVKDFQKATGMLNDDGNVGRATAVALREAGKIFDSTNGQVPLVPPTESVSEKNRENVFTNTQSKEAIKEAVTRDLMGDGKLTKLEVASVTAESANEMKAALATGGKAREKDQERA